MGAGRRPEHIRRAQSGQVPCSGAERRDEALDEVSAAIPGDGVAGNVANNLDKKRQLFGSELIRLLGNFIEAELEHEPVLDYLGLNHLRFLEDLG